MTFPHPFPFVLAVQAVGGDGGATLSEIVEVLEVLTFVGVIALGATLWYLRKIFATREEVEASFASVRKDQEEKLAAMRAQRTEDVETFRAGMKDLREEFHSVLGRMEMNGAQRHDAIVSDIDDLKHDLRRALGRADSASDQAGEARRTADAAAMEIKHLAERVADALQPIRDLRGLPTQVARIEERLELLTQGMDRRHRPGGTHHHDPGD